MTKNTEKNTENVKSDAETTTVTVKLTGELLDDFRALAFIRKGKNVAVAQEAIAAYVEAHRVDIDAVKTVIS